MHVEKRRCAWVSDDPTYRRYHDEEWGKPTWDDRQLFEMLILEGAQAGLSWLTILRKREGYRRAFENFDPELIARFDRARVDALLRNPGIVRNRLKIEATIRNAQACIELGQAFGSFSDYLWSFVGGHPIVNHWRKLDEVPATTPISETMSKNLKKRGFKFVGSTICYAFMQAVGMVNDHTCDCFRHSALGGKSPNAPSDSASARR